jgi:hypothetical protein
VGEDEDEDEGLSKISIMQTGVTYHRTTSDSCQMVVLSNGIRILEGLDWPNGETTFGPPLHIDS